jgi:hypothetical protein
MATEAKEVQECFVCGHSLDVHGAKKCGEAFCKCPEFMRNRPTQAWTAVHWAGRAMQQGRSS